MPRNYARLEQLFLGPEGEIARREDRAMSASHPTQTITVITLPDPRLSRVGSLLTSTDREFRRVANILGTQSEPDSVTIGKGFMWPEPISSLDGGLWISDADVGSVHFIAVPFGELIAVLLSQPVSAFLAAVSLWGSAGYIRTWRQRRKDPLEGVTARQALEVLKAFDGNTSRLMTGDSPNVDLEVAPSVPEHREVNPSSLEDELPAPGMQKRDRRDPLMVERDPPRPPMPEDEPPVPSKGELHEGEQPTDSAGSPVRAAMTINGARVLGRRITHIRQYPDGTIDIIYVEG